MGKNVISEDIQKMVNLIKYNRGMTLTENKHQLNEIIPVVVGAAAVAAGAYGIWSWATDAWGSKSISTSLQSALDSGTWPKIEKSLKETSIKAGEDISSKVDVISANEAKQYAEALYEAMDGIGTDEDNIRDVMDDMGSFMDLARTSYEFGKKEGYTLDYWLDDELSASNYETYVSNPMKSKPAIIFDGKNYNTIADVIPEIEKLATPDVTTEDDPKIELWEGHECVLTTAEDNTAKWNVENTEVLITIGDAMAKFNNSGKFAYKGPDYQDGKKVLTGNYSCKGDDLAFAEDELSLSEGKTLTPALLSRIKNYLSEQITFGSVILPVSGDQGGDTPPGGVVTQQTKCTFDQILAGKCVAKKGQKGEVIGEIQEKLISSGIEGTTLPKHGADKDFGSETELAVKTFQTAKKLTPTGVVDKETAQIIIKVGGQPEIPENEVASTTQKLTDADKVKDAIAQTQQKIAGKPTKEQCVALVGIAAAGLQHNIKDVDKLALGHCFNSYNFGIGKGANKVKKAYNLKGKGNPTK